MLINGELNKLWNTMKLIYILMVASKNYEDLHLGTLKDNNDYTLKEKKEAKKECCLIL